MGPRDGLQNEARLVPTGDKIRLIDMLSGCGFEKIEAAIAVLEGNIEEIDARLMDAGSDVSKAQEIQVERDAKASKMQLYYDEWERLEGVLARAEEIRAAQEVPA